MKVKRKDLLIVLDDHGGHKFCLCAICQQRGWMDDPNILKHKEGCPVADASVEYLYVGYEAEGAQRHLDEYGGMRCTNYCKGKLEGGKCADVAHWCTRPAGHDGPHSCHEVFSNVAGVVQK